jgi:hypothetical protein
VGGGCTKRRQHDAGQVSLSHGPPSTLKWLPFATLICSEKVRPAARSQDRASKLDVLKTSRFTTWNWMGESNRRTPGLWNLTGLSGQVLNHVSGFQVLCDGGERLQGGFEIGDDDLPKYHDPVPRAGGSGDSSVCIRHNDTLM